MNVEWTKGLPPFTYPNELYLYREKAKYGYNYFLDTNKVQDVNANNLEYIRMQDLEEVEIYDCVEKNNAQG